MSEADRYMQRLLVCNPLREPVLREVIEALQLTVGSRGLDAGCGIGLQVVLLAEAVGPAGHVTGVDISSAFLVCAEEIAAKAGLSERVSFQNGDVRELPFDDDAFDWAWSADCVGYAPMDPLPLLKELARVIKPGGRVFILMYSSQQLLPGHPQLEARLNATAAGIAPFVSGMRPERHYFRALGWFREAGLENPTAHTFVATAHAPLSQELRDALIALLDMRWPTAQSEMTADDWALYHRLSQPGSPDFLLDLPDYYAFFIYTLFQGRVPS